MALKDMPQTSKQHAVPQNIMDVDFRLIGDLTMRQFVYLTIFSVLAYVSWINVSGIFKWPVVLFFVILGVGFAFLPVQERGLDEWIINFFRAIYSPTQRVWRKSPNIPVAFLYSNLDTMRHELITLAPTSSRRKLEEYLEHQEKLVEDPLDIPEKAFLLKVREAFAGSLGSVTSFGVPATGVGVSEYPSYPPPAPDTDSQIVSDTVVAPKSDSTAVTKEARSPIKVSDDFDMRDSSAVSAGYVASASSPEEKIAGLPDTSVTSTRPRLKPTLSKGSLTFDLPRRSDVQEVSLEPMTPDRHSGRRFTNLLPSQGDIVLPLRRERVIKTSEDLELEEDVQEKALKLSQLLDQIRGAEGIPTLGKDRGGKKVAKAEEVFPAQLDRASLRSSRSDPQEIRVVAVPKTPQPAKNLVGDPTAVASAINPNISGNRDVGREAEQYIDVLKNENTKLTNEINKLKKEIQASREGAVVTRDLQQKEVALKNLEIERKKKSSDYISLQQQLSGLKDKLKGGFGILSAEDGPEELNVLLSPKDVVTDKRPGVVSGVVKDSAGHILSGALLIIKNEKGEPVRALKTDSVGSFTIVTPLPDGKYTIETSSPEGTTSIFDILSIEVGIGTMSQLEIVGK